MFPVTLNVYDLSGGQARTFSRQLVGTQIDGVWHSGLVIYGKEFYYGGGICYDLPGRTPFGQPTKAISLGETEVPEDIFMEMLRDMASKFTDRTYHVFTNNCNSFTNEVAELLLGESIPREIAELPREFFQTQLGQQIAPLMVNMQKSLQLSSNQLFNDDAQQLILQVRQPGGEQQQPGGQGAAGNNPGLEQLLASMGGNNPAFQRQANQVGASGTPQLGEVCHISSLVQLQTIIRNYHGVVIDFWTPGCGPCMRFKPTFEGACRANQNKHIVFCAVQTDNNRETAQAFQVQSIPQFNFILHGEESARFVGADEIKFRAALGKLQNALSGKAGEHMLATYKQFKPMNRLPMSFAQTAQMDKMKTFIQNLVKNSAGQVQSTTNLMQWIQSSFDVAAIPRGAIDELCELARVAEDKNKIAVCDLFRLLVLKDIQAEYILTHHWSLINDTIIGQLSAQNFSDPEAKVVQNYHQMSLKMLANVFSTPEGRSVMQDLEKGKALIAFCYKSLASCNHKVVYHSALVLFNYLLAYESDSKKKLQEVLEQCLKSIDEALSNPSMIDKDTILALLLCECRILYKNQEMVTWVEEQFKLFFKETHTELSARTSHSELKQAIEDLFSMVTLE